MVACDQNEGDEGHQGDVEVRGLKVVFRTELVIDAVRVFLHVRKVAWRGPQRVLTSLPLLLFQQKWEYNYF